MTGKNRQYSKKATKKTGNMRFRKHCDKTFLNPALKAVKVC